jgi:hypothetical protein
MDSTRYLPDEYPEDRDEIWTTRDGRRVLVMDMSDEHLMNTIRMLERNYAGILQTYLRGPEPHGEMAQDAFESELMHLTNEGPASIAPIYDRMCEEADQRGIDNEKKRQMRRLHKELSSMNYFSDWEEDLHQWTH